MARLTLPPIISAAMPADFPAFFSAAFEDKRTPYAYQGRLASESCISRLISIPTGLGKTAAVILAWLWNRQKPSSAWPRRLVYCLPMRTLVEQTRDEAEKWLQRLELSEEVGLHILMGGEDADTWDLYPEKDAIIIGTQDMLLSRALNRGYGMSRYRWPMHFALLNNDALWVLDETQLMGVGVETSAQLDGFRQLWQRATACPTWWMSATLEDARLATVDHPAPSGGWPRLELTTEEKSAEGVRQRIEAKKPAQKAAFELTPTSKSTHARDLAQIIKAKHLPDTLTLVVVNRVKRARELYAALCDKKLGLEAQRIALIHSRFRPVDRERHSRLLFGDGDRIVIATQAIEAGVDVSARLLVTELAPWSSLVQRFGRCNRAGSMSDAEILWVDILPKDEKDELVMPYTLEGLNKARAAISSLSDGGPKSLTAVVKELQVVWPVIRRRDLMDLFDTTPDLCGQDIDVSRYIRDGEDSDVQFFWRSIAEKESPDVKAAAPERAELCRVTVAESRKFLEKKTTRAWEWNELGKAWKAAGRARPGAVFMIAQDSGGYDDDQGWTGEPKSVPTPHPPTETTNAEGYNDDRQTFARYDLGYQQHVDGVVAMMAQITRALGLPDAEGEMFKTAAHWHDVGKVHEAFQAMLCGDDPARQGTLWAKTALDGERCTRHGFRHELASALAWLMAGPQDVQQRDLIAYIIAAHHGKVRLSIRALPEEKGDPANPERLFARGIWDQDVLPPVPDLITSTTPLDLSLMQMGEGRLGLSWLARMIGLRDQYGPFALAHLEALLRAADMRASAVEASQQPSRTP
jgi:CRISPR-associated endonuclease/helicase Cas3